MLDSQCHQAFAEKQEKAREAKFAKIAKLEAEFNAKQKAHDAAVAEFKAKFKTDVVPNFEMHDVEVRMLQGISAKIKDKHYN